MAETIFAGENIKEFSIKNSFTFFTHFRAVITRFAKNFFLRHRPCDRCDDN